MPWLRAVGYSFCLGQWEDKAEQWHHAFVTTDVIVRGYSAAHGHLGTLDSIRKVGAIGSRYIDGAGTPVRTWSLPYIIYILHSIFRSRHYRVQRRDIDEGSI